MAQQFPSSTEAQRRPYYADYSHTRRSIHSLCTSHYLDLFITFIICLNVITMSMEHYNQPKVARGRGWTGKRVLSREGRGYHSPGPRLPVWTLTRGQPETLSLRAIVLFMTLHIYSEGLPSAPLGECWLPTAEPLDGVCTRPLEHAISLCEDREHPGPFCLTSSAFSQGHQVMASGMPQVS